MVDSAHVEGHFRPGRQGRRFGLLHDLIRSLELQARNRLRQWQPISGLAPIEGHAEPRSIHTQIAQLALDVPRETLSCLPPPPRELNHPLAELFQQSPLLSLQVGGTLLAVGDVLQLKPNLLRVGQNIRNRIAIFPLQATDQRQPLLHLLQTLRAVLDLILVIAQATPQVLKPVVEFLGILQQRLQSGIDPRGLGQGPQRRAQQIERRWGAPVPLLQREVDLVRQLGQALGVGKPGPLPTQFLLLAILQRRRVDFLQLELQQISALSQLPLITPQAF